MTEPLPGPWADGDTPNAHEMNVIVEYIGTYFTPANLKLSGLRAATCDPAAAAATLTLTGGVVYVAKFLWPGGTINTLHYRIGTAGASLTANQNWVGVYNEGGTRLGVSVSQAAQWTFAGNFSTDLTAPITAAAGVYWAAMLSNGTTKPTVYVGGGAMTIGPDVRAGYITAGSATVLPTTFTPATDLTRFNGIGFGVT